MFALMLLTRTALFQEFEAAARDAQARLLAPRVSDRIVLVEIDEIDYDSLFGGTSPLAPHAVLRILDAIRAQGPRAVGVDLETSHPAWRDLAISSTGPPMIWAREAVPCEAARQDVHGSSECHHGDLRALAFLGGRLDESHRFGLVAFPVDHGGTIRQYQRAVSTPDGRLPSFSTALYEAATGTTVADTRLRAIGFRRGEPLRVAARSVIEWASDTSAGRSAPSVLRNRTVLLGGSYRAARDNYHTPLGLLSGVRIIAQVLETEFEGGGETPPSAVRLLLVQSLTVLLLVALFVRFSFPAAFLLTVVTMPVLALAGGWLTTGVAMTGFAYFLPLLIVMLVHILYEKVIEYREALMVELVRQPGAPGERGHGASLDRMESGIGSAIARVRTAFQRRPPTPPPRRSPQPGAVSVEGSAASVQTTDASPAATVAAEPTAPGTGSPAVPVAEPARAEESLPGEGR
jgi:CHASE2 domain-containing sensor protein